MTDTTRPKSLYERGSVVLVLFPHSDLRSAKPRPALVVQANDLQTELSQVIGAMITSNIQRPNHPSRVFFKLSSQEGKQSGLLTDSVIMTDNLATIAENALNRVIGFLSMTEVDKALRHTLNL